MNMFIVYEVVLTFISSRSSSPCHFSAAEAASQPLRRNRATGGQGKGKGTRHAVVVSHRFGR